MNIPIIKKEIDERYLTHRLKSTSLAGVIGGLTAVGLFAYYLYGEDVVKWELLAVGVTMMVVKLAAMAWYRFTD